MNGSVCVVTGASSGIGRRTALDLARDGAAVCAVARREPLLRTLVDEMGGSSRGHSAFTCDVSCRDDVRALARHVGEAYGRCDVLVNNAGVGSKASFEGPEAFDAVKEVMDVNFFGAVACTAELLQLLERSAPSHVVNVASIAGRIAVPTAAPYCASKFALVGWSEALHFELLRRGVYVSSVEPGLVPTEGFPRGDLEHRPVLRRALATTEDVSAAIREAIAEQTVQRTVPRWYYALQVVRVLAPPLFRAAQRRLRRR